MGLVDNIDWIRAGTGMMKSQPTNSQSVDDSIFKDMELPWKQN